MSGFNDQTGRLGAFHGTEVYGVEKSKFQTKNSNENFIYALGTPGSSEVLPLVAYDSDNKYWCNVGTMTCRGDIKLVTNPTRFYERVSQETAKREKKKKIAEEKKTYNVDTVVSTGEYKSIDMDSVDLFALSEGVDKYLLKMSKEVLYEGLLFKG